MTSKLAVLSPVLQRTRARTVVLPPAGQAPALIRCPKIAERWRGAFLALVRQEHAPEELHNFLDNGIKNRAWVMLRDHEGKAFRSFERFCISKQPHGLGTEPDVVRAFVERLLGRRAATLALTAPSNQGRRPLADETSRPGGEKSNRHEQRLRAVARAPEPIQQLCRLGVLTYKQTAAFGPAKPSQAERVKIEAFVAEAERVAATLKDAPSDDDLATARSSLNDLLATGPKGGAERLVRLFLRLRLDEQAQFLELLRREIGLQDRLDVDLNFIVPSAAE